MAKAEDGVGKADDGGAAVQDLGVITGKRVRLTAGNCLAAANLLPFIWCPYVDAQHLLVGIISPTNLRRVFGDPNRILHGGDLKPSVRRRLVVSNVLCCSMFLCR